MKLFNGEDDVPLYTIRHEAVGYAKRKVWTVREYRGLHKLVTVMGNKKDAMGWVKNHEKNTRYR
jgi:hypothetical protein